MFDRRAAQLQQQALEALSDLRVWIWARHGELLPDDLAAVTHEEAQRYAAYLDWYSRVEEVLLALASTGTPAALSALPATPEAAPAPELVPEQLTAPTLRAPSAYGCSERTEGWQPPIPVLASLTPQGADSRAA